MDCHLADMLQQLTAVNSAKPSERVAVRQGESGSYRYWPSWVTGFSVTDVRHQPASVSDWKAEN